MNILTFEATGIYAHFRKIYTNSSSLSYYFPPPTTVAGMVAAMLGRERDSYYEEFRDENFKVAVKILKPLRKMTHTVNYMLVKGRKDLYNRTTPTQIPYEILTGVQDEVEYKFYFWHKDNDLLYELSDRIKNGKFAFPPYFGAAPFSCFISGGDIIETEEIAGDSLVSIHSVVNVQHIVENSIEVINGLTRIIKDIIPVAFNADRVPERTAGVIFDEKCTPIMLKLNTKYLSIDNENIVFI